MCTGDHKKNPCGFVVSYRVCDLKQDSSYASLMGLDDEPLFKTYGFQFSYLPEERASIHVVAVCSDLFLRRVRKQQRLVQYYVMASLFCTDLLPYNGKLHWYNMKDIVYDPFNSGKTYFIKGSDDFTNNGNVLAICGNSRIMGWGNGASLVHSIHSSSMTFDMDAMKNLMAPLHGLGCLPNEDIVVYYSCDDYIVLCNIRTGHVKVAREMPFRIGTLCSFAIALPVWPSPILAPPSESHL
ncbi:hypothetical protein Tsubulata_037739 [Turnera subulata]|uniref:DUF295 domain-containing protein n=1 Tax=Turnera subulata TaxID=218843 RepID=A0A9Q0GJB6_9ROSI|nr:hypothetical protein Tsubulata_037739 [Turnera subulata]